MITTFLKKDPVQRSRGLCKKKFLYYFRKGYQDPKYIDWERQYKLDAHIRFQQALNREAFADLLNAKQYERIASLAVNIESKTNLLFSFEKMALRDAVKTLTGARAFAAGLFDYIYGQDELQVRFENFVQVIGKLPRRQTRVLTWPLVTVFGFIGNPAEHIFLKPRVTQAAAKKYRFDFEYESRPNWETYQSLLSFARQVKADTKEYNPRDQIDIQSFIWVLGSEEYPD